ncbi:ATP-binding protein [Streptomyces sp. NPDC026673]|uniref:ATP-binding protein n=1 Tax=Streptomyces sp. NPDC026673 TaxID=3155724 RepID=UPI0033D54A5E
MVPRAAGSQRLPHAAPRARGDGPAGKWRATVLLLSSPRPRGEERTKAWVASSNKPFGRWGEVFGDDTVDAMIDRLVHHADVASMDGHSYRLEDRDIGRTPSAVAG